MEDIKNLLKKIEKIELELKIEKSNFLTVEKKSKKLQLYLDALPVILVVINKSERVEFINDYGVKSLGFNNKNEVEGKNWFDEFIPLKIRENVRFVFTKIISGDLEPVKSYSNPVRTKFGSEKRILWRNSYLKDENGNIVSSVSLGCDSEFVKTLIENFKPSTE